MKRSNLELDKTDGYGIKSALLKYISPAAESDLIALRKDLLNYEPEIDAEGVLRIGEWVYDQESNTLIRYLPPDRSVGYDYLVRLQCDGNIWTVTGIERREVFIDWRSAG